MHTLKAQKLVLDWLQWHQSRAAVRLCIEEFLGQSPPAFNADLYRSKCEAVYQHVYDSYGAERARAGAGGA